MKIPPWLVAAPIHGLYRLWCASLRITESNRDVIDAMADAGTPMMFCLWHDELFPLMHVRRNLRIVTVVSQSNDGEYLARLLQALGLLTARGSSSRGGLSALLQTSRLMKEKKYNGCLTVDGPRGPRHIAKDGAVFLAFRTPAPIVPVRLFMERTKVFRSWDRFQLPLPFSRVHVRFGSPYAVAATDLNPESLECERIKLQNKLDALSPPGDWPGLKNRTGFSPSSKTELHPASHQTKPQGQQSKHPQAEDIGVEE